MSQSPALTDRRALVRNRRRAARRGPENFLHALAADEIKDRLSLVNKSFKKPVIVTGHRAFWRAAFPELDVIEDCETLSLEPASRDLVIHAMALHWANDPIGQVIQSARALQPDGLFMAVLFGGQTLNELRSALAQAEAEVAGGLSPRVAPMADIRELGGLLQRAGLALPVVDNVALRTSYASPRDLMHELRAMGEGNAMSARRRCFSRRAVFERAEAYYREVYSEPGHRVRATFDLMFLLGWAPHPTQQKPLRPGSAAIRLADAIGSTEIPIED